VKVIPRDAAIEKLRELIGSDLREMANQFGITVFKGTHLNKGWAGLVLERYLGLRANPKQVPDTTDWELKLVPLKRAGKKYVPKETMAITMINPEDVLRNAFEHSHLYDKLKSMIVCGRLFVDRTESKSPLVKVGTFDLVADRVKGQVRRDYEFVRDMIHTKGFGSLSGEMGILVQPRTKGPGHGSTSRAFYARVIFVKEILKL
jgi:DNA mismatch repair protein MutH